MPDAKRVPLKDRKPDEPRRPAVIDAEDQEIDESLAPASITRHELRTMDFFQLLTRLSPGEWDSYMPYLYRSKGSGIIKTNPKDDHFIDKIPFAFDESYVKEKFGGGGYTVILNHSPSRKAVRKHTFHIDGPPKLQPGELDTRAKSGDGGPGGKSDVALMIEQMNVMFAKIMELAKRNDGAEQDALTRVITTMQRGTEAVIDVQKSAFEKQITAQIGSSTGNPLVDKFLEASIAKLGTAAPDQTSQIKQIAEMFAMFTQITGGGGKGAGLLGNLSEIKGVLEVLKDMGIKIGGGGEALGGEMDWKSVVAAQVPAVVQMGLSALEEWRKSSDQTRLQLAQIQARLAGAQVPQQLPQGHQPPPAQPAPPQPQAQPQPQPVTSSLPANFAAAQPQATPEPGSPPAANVVEFPQSPPPIEEAELEVNLDLVATLIRRCFLKDDPGDAAAMMLKRLYETQLQAYMPYLTDIVQLNQLVRMSPILAEVIQDENWPVFQAEFVREMKRNEDEEMEPDPEPQQQGS